MIDISKLKAGAVVKLADGAVGEVRGSYLSTDGLVLRVNTGGGIVDRNVPLDQVMEVADAVSLKTSTGPDGSGPTETSGG